MARCARPSADPQKVLRHALARAGMVIGYEHVCRRCKGRGNAHTERHLDADERRCPACGMRLWPKALPRPMRFHDLRHTTATLLLRSGVPLHHVQRIMRHRDVRLTTETYGHLVADDLRDAVAERLLTVREVAAVLRVSRATVYAMCSRGELKFLRVSHSLRIRILHLQQRT